jgi:uncharacterized phage-like protein YoqJ
MILAGTGHRELPNYDLFKTKVQETFAWYAPNKVIHGCAAGFDLNFGKIALDMNIDVVSAKPWTTHQPREEDAELYNYVLSRSVEVVVVTESDTYPGPEVYHIRNQWMVDHCDELIAWWDGRETGGTYAAIQYAIKTGKPWKNIYAED